MSTALQYPVSLGYWSTAAPYSPARPHRGIDFKATEGVPIVIGSTVIGLTGHTGNADGPHVHVQAGRDEWAQTTISPAPFVGRAGKVAKLGFASEWGNYVCVLVGDVYVYYCHLSRIFAQLGQLIEEVHMVEDNQLDYDVLAQTFVNMAGRKLSRDEFKTQVGRSWQDVLITFQGSVETDKFFKAAQVGLTDVSVKKLEQVKAIINN